MSGTQLRRASLKWKAVHGWKTGACQFPHRLLFLFWYACDVFVVPRLSLNTCWGVKVPVNFFLFAGLCKADRYLDAAYASVVPCQMLSNRESTLSSTTTHKIEKKIKIVKCKEKSFYVCAPQAKTAETFEGGRKTLRRCVDDALQCKAFFRRRQRTIISVRKEITDMTAKNARLKTIRLTHTHTL